ncbi:hypothetical protein P7C71_g434, partial [Lecanoromycetidae sp. Uapishka_2]
MVRTSRAQAAAAARRTPTPEDASDEEMADEQQSDQSIVDPNASEDDAENGIDEDEADDQGREEEEVEEVGGAGDKKDADQIAMMQQTMEVRKLQAQKSEPHESEEVGVVAADLVAAGGENRVEGLHM